MARTAQPSTDMTSSPTCIHACICVHIVACARVLVLENITSKSDQVLNMTLSPTLTVPLLAAGPSSARPTIRMPACVCSCLCARACVQACMRACVYGTYTQSISPMVRLCQFSPGPACTSILKVQTLMCTYMHPRQGRPRRLRA